MAQLNFNALIPQGGPQGFYQGFEQGQKEQQANVLASQKQAQEQEMNALRMQQSRGALEQQESTRKKQALAEKVSMFRDRLARTTNPEAAREIVKMQYADPDLGPLAAQGGSLEQALAEVSDDPVQFERYKQQEIMGAAEFLKSQMPKVTPTGDVYDPATRTFIRKPQAAAAPSAPVAVMGPDGRPIYVPREQAIGMTPFTPAAVKFMQPPAGPAVGGGVRAPAAPVAPKPMTELQSQSQRKLMASDKTSVKASQSVVGELEKLTDELVGNPDKGIRPDPGLSGITGYQALIPSLPKSDARKAQQKLETMKGKVMAFGRQLASLEGKLGNMAVQEWKFVSDSVQSIDPAAGNLDVQLRDIVRQAKNFADTVQSRYDLTYEGAGASESEAAPPKLNPQDKEALNWANSNPNDPRAAQIKQRLKVQ